MSVEMKEASDQELWHWYGAPIFHLQKHYPPPPPFFSSIHLCLQMFKAQYHLNHFLFHRWMLYQLLLSNIMQTIQQVRLPNQTALKFPSILNMSNIFMVNEKLTNEITDLSWRLTSTEISADYCTYDGLHQLSSRFHSTHYVWNEFASQLPISVIIKQINHIVNWY